jgi:release factor glutamine methyltransferase
MCLLRNNVDNIDENELRSLREEKYNGNKDASMSADIERLKSGEPLAYVLNTQPFLGLTIHLDTHPLIPRPETEWWVEKLIEEKREQGTDTPYEILDIGAGSGAIGIALMKAFPNSVVTFVEKDAVHLPLIRKNILENNLNLDRAHILEGDVWSSLPLSQTFDIIATNPPYIPNNRVLEHSVTGFEPSLALYGGADGLSVIQTILEEANERLREGGSLWLECDSEHADVVLARAKDAGLLSSTLHHDQYGRPRLLVSYR